MIAVCTDFNPRSPRGERRLHGLFHGFGWPSFQSTLPARGATSTHRKYAARISHFNPRSPRGERRNCQICLRRKSSFQSTLPARGATLPARRRLPPRGSNFNPRSPRGERRSTRSRSSGWKSNFNPRSPRGERLLMACAPSLPCEFQSTLPARGATLAR